MPIPLYLIDCFGRYDCDRKCNRISEILKDKETIDGFLRLYKATIQGYTNQWDKINEGRGYNVMIKSDIDMNLMDSAEIYGRKYDVITFIKITPLKASHRTKVEAFICENCRIVEFEY